MKIEHLEFFTKVAQCGSINKAAAQLYISQPHLSRIIKDIEDGVGSDLFFRTRAGVSLTPDGKVFLEHSMNVLNEMKILERISLSKIKKQTFSVSMTRSSHVMESFIDVCKLHEKDLSYSFLLHENPPLEVVNDVLSGRADIGVFQLDHPCSTEILDLIRSKGLSFHSLAVLEPHIVLSQNHQLIKKGLPITLKSLSDYGFVRYNGDYEDFTYHLRVNGEDIDLNDSARIVRIHGRASLLHLIATSDFYTVGIQSFEQQQAYYNIISVPIEGCEDRLEFAYIVPEEVTLSSVTLEFIESLNNRFRNLNR